MLPPRSWRPARGWSPPYQTQALPVTLRDELQATVAGGHDRVASSWSPANTRKVRPSHECSAKVAERTPPLRAPREYTPRHLAEKILQSRSALEGERKQVTVVFADVKGSMELAEQLDPEAWSEIMQHSFRILSEGVGRFEVRGG